MRIVGELGITWHELGNAFWYQGTGFAHLQKSGAKGRGRFPQGAAISTIINRHRSFVVGDEHKKDIRMSHTSDGGVITAMKAGCMVSHKEIDTASDEWAGAFLLTHMQDGTFCINEYPYDYIMERWGRGGYAQELRMRRAQEARDLDDARHAFA